MFERENDFYSQNKIEFRNKYIGKRLVIQGAEVKGVYDSDEEAYRESTKTMAPGTFVIKWVRSDEEESPVYLTRIYA